MLNLGNDTTPSTDPQVNLGIAPETMDLKEGDTSLQNNIRDITANINSCL